MKLKGIWKLVTMSLIGMVVMGLVAGVLDLILGGFGTLGQLAELLIYIVVIGTLWKKLGKEFDQIHELLYVWIIMAVVASIVQMIGFSIAGIALETVLTPLSLAKIISLTVIGLFVSHWILRMVGLVKK